MKIVEMIYFTHELDMLEAHLEEHSQFVDKFVVKESPILWSGKPHPLVCTENADRFKRFNMEIIVIPPEEYEYVAPSFPPEEHKKWFDARRNNRNKAKTYKWEEIGKGFDWIFSFDCDEIISGEQWYKIEEILTNRPDLELANITLRQFNQWMNNRQKKRLLYRIFNAKGPFIGNPRTHRRTPIGTVGWHFTNMFDAAGYKTKLEGICTHLGFNGYEKTPSVDDIDSLLENKKMVLSKKDPVHVIPKEKIIKRFPKYIQRHPERFPWL